MRFYPALDVTWSTRPDDDHVERLLAEIDDEQPTAVEAQPSGLRIFFTSPVARGRAAACIIAWDTMARCAPREVPDEDWARRSQAQIAAVRVGALTIAPPWDLPEHQDGLIIINPGMGFGTGQHESTRLGLRLLQQRRLAGARVLDVGTGSGVLAFAAWKLGAAAVVGVDFDEDALTSARENLALNGAPRCVSFAACDLAAPNAAALERDYDVVLANLTGGLLTRHAPALRACLGAGGALIVSGLTLDEEADVAGALSAAGLVPGAREAELPWVGLAFTSPTPPTTR
jgi:ribosomal protein L11 methyltransferase